MEKKNEPMSAVDTNKLALGRALMHIVYSHCADAEDQNIRTCVDELMVYFAEASRRKEREVLKQIKAQMELNLIYYGENDSTLEFINSRLASLKE